MAGNVESFGVCGAIFGAEFCKNRANIGFVILPKLEVVGATPSPAPLKKREKPPVLFLRLLLLNVSKL